MRLRVLRFVFFLLDLFLAGNGDLLVNLHLVARDMLLLLNINVGNRTLKPVAGVKVPVSKDEHRSRSNNDNSPVHILGCHGAGSGEDKEDCDNHDPDTGDDTDRDRETTQRDGTVLKGVARISDAAEGREAIGDVKTNGRDTGDGREGSRVDEVQQSEEGRDKAREPDSPDWRVECRVDPVEVLRARHGSITREGVDHARVGGDRGASTEELGQQQDDQQQQRSSITH